MNDTRKVEMKGERELRWLIASVLLALLALIANVVIYYQDGQRDQIRAEKLADMRLIVKNLQDVTAQSVAGDVVAFDTLQSMENQHRQSSQSIIELSLSDNRQNLPLTALRQTGGTVSQTLQAIMSHRDGLMMLRTDAELLLQSLPAIRQQWADIAELLLSRNANDRQVMLVNQQAWLLDRMIRQLDYVVLQKADGQNALERFAKDEAKLKQVTEDLMRGNSQASIQRITDTTAIGLLAQIDEQQAMLSRSMAQLDELAQTYGDAHTLLQALSADAKNYDNAITALQNSIAQLNNQRLIGWRSLLAVAFVTIMLIVWVFVRQRRLAQQQLQEAAEATERNQKAILRLLDELADLADGDLTISATVTEDFTGAIADSINFTIDQLRVLVSNINDTAVKVSTAAQDSQATALQLAKASEHQAHEIAGASSAINEMAVTIDQVSINAEESARVADRSVELADTGALVVRNTIAGMDTIREQIQDTAKRIKRLGESSQEIGDIISLINDIADQTNILALNAAIQASMAGDAGRGFAVVADEVQRLAERSSAATRQIEALVKTIQSDTSEAVISMEKTTADVVRGAELANDAGTALSEIEEVSNDLAELIQNISNAARQQASSAGHVSNTMNVIQDITSQTAQGTMATAKSIGNLSDLANQLRNSVAGFTLPNQSLDNVSESAE